MKKKSIPPEDGTFYEEQKIVFTDEGVSEVSKGTEHFFRWNAIHAVDETEDHIFIYTDTMVGIILPKREIPSTEIENNISKLLADKTKSS